MNTPSRPTRVVVGWALVVAALVTGGAAYALAASSDSSADGAPFRVKTTTTLSPTTSTEVVVTRPPVPATTDTPPTIISPLAAQLGEAVSVIPAPPAASIAPVAISIEGIKLDTAPIVPVGVDPDGEFQVPGAFEVGWYQFGSAPGQSGSTVLAAHVNWQGDDGRFLRLGKVEANDLVTVASVDGSSRRYRVVERAMYDKQTLPYDRIWAQGGPETLVLITCGGEFNRKIHRYKQNIVVYAVPEA
jgi:LPXTG-site transpeptidase (sortase) family protein